MSTALFGLNANLPEIPFFLYPDTSHRHRRYSSIIFAMSTPSGWESLSSDLDTSALKTKICTILRSTFKPWNDIILTPKSPVDVVVVNVLQKVSRICFFEFMLILILQELDDARRDKHRNKDYISRCFKCLRALSKERDIFPQCFSMSDGITRESGDPIDGGGAAVSSSRSRLRQTEHWSLL